MAAPVQTLYISVCFTHRLFEFLIQAFFFNSFHSGNHFTLLITLPWACSAVVCVPVRLQQAARGLGQPVNSALCSIAGWCSGLMCRFGAVKGGYPTARWPGFIFRILKCTELLKRNIWKCKREGITEHYPPNYTMRRATCWQYPYCT